ncbi:MAG: hypothetical protein R3B13_12185 [Polyangiaceae bacterium]
MGGGPGALDVGPLPPREPSDLTGNGAVLDGTVGVPSIKDLVLTAQDGYGSGGKDGS